MYVKNRCVELSHISPAKLMYVNIITMYAVFSFTHIIGTQRNKVIGGGMV